MVDLTCHCGKPYQARQADLDRGWGRSCSRRCAAIKRDTEKEQGIHQPAPATKAYRRNQVNRSNNSFAELSDELGWDGHKGIT